MYRDCLAGEPQAVEEADRRDVGAREDVDNVQRLNDRLEIVHHHRPESRAMIFPIDRQKRDLEKLLFVEKPRAGRPGDDAVVEQNDAVVLKIENTPRNILRAHGR